MATNAQRISDLEAWRTAHKAEHAANPLHKHDAAPPPPPPPPPASNVLMDTSVEGWAKWGPVFHRDDAGFGQDSDFGDTMAQISVDSVTKILTGRAERKATRSGRSYASFAIGTNVYDTPTNVIQDRFSFLYGTIEARVKHPAGQGVFAAALWLLQKGRNQTPPEVDVQEALPGPNGGNGPNLITHTNWYAGPNGLTAEVNPATGLTYIGVGGKDWTLAPHTYKWVWTPSWMDYYVDGVKSGRHVQVPKVPMFPIINLAMGGSPGGTYKTDATTPATLVMVIDYVRVWAP